jgi:hypothetical protein
MNRRSAAKRLLLGGAALLALTLPVLAYVEFPTASGPVGGNVLMWLNAGGQAIGASGSNPLPVSGGATASQTLAQTVQAAAYASGNSVGGLLSFTAAARTGRSTGLVQAITLAMPDALNLTLDVVLFNANPTASTITDKTAIAIATADTGKMIGVVHISDCTSYSVPTLCQAQTVTLPFALPSGQTLYAAVVSRAAFTPTGTSWSATLTTLQD